MTGDLLAQARSAQSDQERTLLVIRDLLEDLSPELRAAAWAAAVPHWFESEILAALLEVSPKEARSLYAQLIELPFVEPFAGRGHNVHELARETMLADWWETRREEYLALSARAAEHFGAQETPEAQIERVYHLLVVDEDRGADALWNLGAEWNNAYQYDRAYALAQAGVEHVEAGRIKGRGAGWALYRMGQAQARLYLNQEALENLRQARGFARRDDPLRANAISSLGDVHVMLAEYGEARERYEQALPIYREIGDRLGEANALFGLGDVHVKLAEYETARPYYAQAQPIYREIGSRYNEALALSGLGTVCLGEGDYLQALALYRDAGQRFRALGVSERPGRWVTQEMLSDLRARLAEQPDLPGLRELVAALEEWRG